MQLSKNKTYSMNEVEIDTIGGSNGSNKKHQEQELDTVGVEAEPIVFGEEDGAHQLAIGSIRAGPHNQC